ncbi:MAG: ferritin [Anaerolineales bacterium]|nr:ferritin [Anaerolineales bacterium]
MIISPKLTKAINGQIGNEFGASLQYLSIAGYFQTQRLNLLSKLFFEQADEEKEHAMKFVHYVLDTQGKLEIPAVNAPKPTFSSAEEAVQAALAWEKEVTEQIKKLMDIATEENDYLAQNFLQWFIDEQLEEINKMDQLLSVIQRAGEKNLLMVEAYLVHIEKAS